MPKSSKSPPTTDDDDPIDPAVVDELLNADDPTLDRYWRYKVLGRTMGQLTAELPRKNQARCELDRDDYRIVVAAARHFGMPVATYVRLALARAVMMDFDLDPDVIPSLARDVAR